MVVFSLRAVINMETGMSPETAAKTALKEVVTFYPKFSGAVVAADRKGNHGMCSSTVVLMQNSFSPVFFRGSLLWIH